MRKLLCNIHNKLFDNIYDRNGNPNIKYIAVLLLLFGIASVVYVAIQALINAIAPIL